MSMKESLRALVFDLFYNRYYGVVVYIRIFEGELAKKQKVKFYGNLQKIYQIERLGVKIPKEIFKDKLIEGEIGWFTANIRDMKEVKIGDTVLDINGKNVPLIDHLEENKPNIYSNLYPDSDFEYKDLKKSLIELQIQDSSLILENVDSQLLGPGFRCGFVGLLHQEVIIERLENEYNCKIITTPPSITYKITTLDGKKIETNNPQKIPSSNKIVSIEELFISLNIDTPVDYLGSISQLCQNKRGIYQSQEWKTESFYQLNYHLPLAEFIIDFHEKIKSISRGYASFNYRIIGFRTSEIVKINILLNNELVTDLSFLTHQTFAYERAKKMCKHLKETISKKTFSIPIQACIDGRIIARETLPALKKNVTGNLYGGDRTRKMKLWTKQKIGKKRMKKLGKVNIESSNIKNILQNNKY